MAPLWMPPPVAWRWPRLDQPGTGQYRLLGGGSSSPPTGCPQPGTRGRCGLYEAVKAVGRRALPGLGITIPVGKDSMSMKTRWQQDGKSAASPRRSPLLISAFARVEDVRNTVTPHQRTDPVRPTLSSSTLVTASSASAPSPGPGLPPAWAKRPGSGQPGSAKGFFNAIQALVADRKLIAYHDRSDGGLFVTLTEMAFAGHCGLDIQLDRVVATAAGPVQRGAVAVIQVRREDKEAVPTLLAGHGLAACPTCWARCAKTTSSCSSVPAARFIAPAAPPSHHLGETSYQMQRLRDNPECADQEHAARQDATDPGLQARLTYNPSDDVAAPYIAGFLPCSAILREQGVNSHAEMAAAFDRAGRTAVDAHERHPRGRTAGRFPDPGGLWRLLLRRRWGGRLAKSILFNDNAR